LVTVNTVAISSAFESSLKDKLQIGEILNSTSIHRLKLERYLSEAESMGLVERDILNRFSVTDDGYEYLVNHRIIEA